MIHRFEDKKPNNRQFVIGIGPGDDVVVGYYVSEESCIRVYIAPNHSEDNHIFGMEYWCTPDDIYELVKQAYGLAQVMKAIINVGDANA